MVGSSESRSAAASAECGGTSGSAASSALMPAAADCPTMPWCNTMRRSRNGRNTSVPAISTISKAWMLISPCDTRHTPSASAAAAPTATPQSVMPRVMTLVDSTRRVLSHNSPRLLGEPPAIGACSGRTPSGSAAPGPRRETPSRTPSAPAGAPGWCGARRWAKTVGAIRVTSAAISITVATGRSHQAMKAKIAIGVSTAIDRLAACIGRKSSAIARPRRRPTA